MSPSNIPLLARRDTLRKGAQGIPSLCSVWEWGAGRDVRCKAFTQVTWTQDKPGAATGEIGRF